MRVYVVSGGTFYLISGIDKHFGKLVFVLNLTYKNIEEHRGLNTKEKQKCLRNSLLFG